MLNSPLQDYQTEPCKWLIPLQWDSAVKVTSTFSGLPTFISTCKLGKPPSTFLSFQHFLWIFLDWNPLFLLALPRDPKLLKYHHPNQTHTLQIMHLFFLAYNANLMTKLPFKTFTIYVKENRGHTSASPQLEFGVEFELLGCLRFAVFSNPSPPLSFNSFPSFTDFFAANSFNTSAS